jgi:hypothetical protein
MAPRCLGGEHACIGDCSHGGGASWHHRGVCVWPGEGLHYFCILEMGRNRAGETSRAFSWGALSSFSEQVGDDCGWGTGPYFFRDNCASWGVATLVCGFGLYVHCKVFASSS